MSPLLVVGISSIFTALWLQPKLPSLVQGVAQSQWLCFSVLACALALGRFIYGVILYPVLFTPFRGLPSPPGRSIWNGHVKIITGSPPGYYARKWTRDIRNDGLIRFYSLFNTEMLLPTSLNALADILVHKAYDFDKPEYIRLAMSQIAGHGILVAQGSVHRVQRRKLNAAFSFRHIKDLYPIFWSKGVEVADAIEAAIANLATDKKTVQMSHWATLVTLDIIGLAAIDLDFGSVKAANNKLNREYRKMLHLPEGIEQYIELFTLFFLPQHFERLPTRRQQAVRAGASYIRNLASELIREKKEKIDGGMSTSNDIISVLLKNGGFAQDSLTEQLMTFLAAGHESTSTALQWAVYALCKHRDVQRRLREEIRSFLPLTNDNQPMTAALLDSLPYLNAVCNEVLRYYPPVRETDRVAVRDTTVDGIFIRKGTRFCLVQEAINHSEEFWGNDADKFDPDRWMGPGNGNSGGALSNYAFLTFIHGPRSCIGAGFAKSELACLVAVLVSRFEMELQDPGAKLEVEGFATQKPKDGVIVRLKVLQR